MSTSSTHARSQEEPAGDTPGHQNESRCRQLRNRLLRSDFSAEIMAIPGVDIVVGTQDRTKPLGYITEFKAERQPIKAVGNIMKNRNYEEMDVPEFTGNPVLP